LLDTFEQFRGRWFADGPVEQFPDGNHISGLGLCDQPVRDPAGHGWRHLPQQDGANPGRPAGQRIAAAELVPGDESAIAAPSAAVR